MSPDERSAVRRSNPRDGVALLTLDRAASRNVLDDELRDGLIAALEATDADADVRAVVLTGGSEVFAAGADIRAMRDQGFQDAIAARGARLWGRLAAVRKPLIAAVAGPAVGGGCELALACDLIVAGDQVTFGTPEINVGVFPFMIMAIIYRNVGRKKATELLLLGERISAAEAERIGIVNKVVPAAELDAAVDAWAQKIARSSPLLMSMGKDAISRQMDMPLDDGLDFLRGQLALAFSTEDIQEGVKAFFEKREPQWKGR